MAAIGPQPSRNSICPCGSALRYKHCCGSLGEAPPWTGLTERERDLLPTILAVDEAGLQAGRDPSQRSFDTMMKASEILYPGRVFIMTGQGAGNEAEEIGDLVSKLYRPEDIGVGGMHIGVFMFRDIFVRMIAPYILGRTGVDFLKLTDLTDTQKHWVASRPGDMGALTDQFIDLFDFGYGLDELGHTRAVPPDCQTMMGLSSFQLQAAASTLLTAFDRRGAVQAASLATELALKGGLIANGFTVDELKDSKKYGHHHDKLALALAAKEPAFDADRVLTTISKFPEFVPNRYSPTQPSRVEAGHIVMGAQYISAEVMRLLSARNMRLTGGMETERTYPPSSPA
jgi:hypothetical protein